MVFGFHSHLDVHLLPVAAEKHWLAEERVNVRVSEVLTSAFPRRCFVAV